MRVNVLKNGLKILDTTKINIFKQTFSPSYGTMRSNYCHADFSIAYDRLTSWLSWNVTL